MEIIIQPTSEEASVIGAHIIANLVREKPACVLGLATGRAPGTFVGMSARLLAFVGGVVTLYLVLGRIA